MVREIKVKVSNIAVKMYEDETGWKLNAVVH